MTGKNIKFTFLLTVLLILTSNVALAGASDVITDNLITFQIPYDGGDLTDYDITGYVYEYSRYNEERDLQYKVVKNDNAGRWDVTVTGICQNQLPVLFYINTTKNVYKYEMDENDVGKTVNLARTASQEGQIAFYYNGSPNGDIANAKLYGLDHNNKPFEIGWVENGTKLPVGNYSFMFEEYVEDVAVIDYKKNVTVSGNQQTILDIDVSQLAHLSFNIDSSMTIGATAMFVETNLDHDLYGYSAWAELYIDLTEGTKQVYIPEIEYEEVKVRYDYQNNNQYPSITYELADMNITAPSETINLGWNFSLELVEDSYYAGQSIRPEEFIQMYDEYDNIIHSGWNNTILEEMSFTLNQHTTTYKDYQGTITLPETPGTYSMSYKMAETMIWPYTNNASSLRLVSYENAGTAQFRIYTDTGYLGKYDICVNGIPVNGGRVDDEYDFEYDIEKKIVHDEENGYYDITVYNLDFDYYSSYFITVRDENCLFGETFTTSGQSKTQRKSDLVTYSIVDSAPNYLSKYTYVIYVQSDEETVNDYELVSLHRLNSDKLLLPPHNNYTICIIDMYKNERISNYIYMFDANANKTIDISNRNLYEVNINMPDDILFDNGGVYGTNENVNSYYHGDFYDNFRANKIYLSDNVNELNVILESGNYRYVYAKDINQGTTSPITMDIGTHITGSISQTAFTVGEQVRLRSIISMVDQYNTEVECYSWDEDIYEFVWSQNQHTVLRESYGKSWGRVNTPTAPGTYTLDINIDLGKLGTLNLSRQVTVNAAGPVDTDFDDDGDVDEQDLAIIKDEYGKTSSSESYESTYDVVPDSIVDIRDIVRTAKDMK